MAEGRELLGVLSATELYTFKEFSKRLGLKYMSMRALRQRGLPFIKVGNRKFFSGRQVIAFLEGLGNGEG